jgi:hypothetical protein
MQMPSLCGDRLGHKRGPFFLLTGSFFSGIFHLRSANENIWMLTEKCGSHADVGKFTLKSNGDEALSDEFLLKSNGDEALNDVFP